MAAEGPLPSFEPATYDSTKKSLTLKGFTAVISDDKCIGDETCGLTKWIRGGGDVFWKVKFYKVAQLDVAMTISNDEKNAESEIEAEIDGQKVSAATTPTGGPGKFATVAMGSIKLGNPGVSTVTVRVKSAKSGFASNLKSLVLSGPAAEKSAEERIPRDISPSILQMKEGVQYDMVYNSVTPIASYMGTNFVLCGSQGPDNLSLCDTDFEGDQSITFDFTDQKTVFPWKLNETYHFVLRAVPQDDKKAVNYFAYVYGGEESKWKQVGAQKKDVEERLVLIEGPSSQIYQSYGGQQGYYPREALFGPMWAKPPGGEWEELSEAKYAYVKYSADNGNASVEDCRFRLRTGGDTKMTAKPGAALSAKKSGQLPDILKDIESKLPK